MAVTLSSILSQAGFKGNALKTAEGVALAESGANATAHNPNASTGDNSYGLFQINMIGSLGPDRLKRYGLSSNEALYDPLTNAIVAFKMSGGGTNWSPWTTFTGGAYKAGYGKDATIKNAPGGGTSTPLTSMPNTTNPGSSGGGTWTSSSGGTTTLDKMLGLPAETTVNAGTIPMLTAKVAELLKAGTITDTQSQSLLQTIGSMGVSHSNPTLGSRTVDPATGQANLGITVPDIGTAINFLALILVGVAFLGLGGLIALRKKSD